MIKQRTIKYSISVKGIGVHSGVDVCMLFKPAPPNTGIVFRRVDLKQVIDIPAKLENVVNTTYSTTIGVQGEEVKTIEHLMSALYGEGIDNLIIEINNYEVPIMDGSANDFLFILKSAGIVEQNQARSYLQVLKKVSVTNNNSTAFIEPYDGFKLSFCLDYDHEFFRNYQQTDVFDFKLHSYEKSLARARTFGFLKEAEYMRKNNLAMGSSLDNTIVLNDNEVINAQGLRNEKELVRHKILDAIGDIYLGGYHILGAFSGNKSGHRLNNKLMNKLIADKTAWRLIKYSNNSQSVDTLFPQTANIPKKVAVL